MKRMLFSSVAISLCFVILEIFMIVAEPYLHRGAFEYDADLGFRVRPGRLNSNSFGFNDKEYDLEPEAGVLRILFVGDSFSWGGGIKQNYAAILERMFERHHGRHRVDIINGGYPMTHTGEHVLMLKKYGLQYNPHMVFLGFFLGNDFLHHTSHRKRIVVWGTYFDIDDREEVTLLGYPIVGQSRLLHFFKQHYIVLRNRYEANRQEQRRLHREKSAKKPPRPNTRKRPDPSPWMPLEQYLRTEGSMLHVSHHTFRDHISVELVRQSVSEMNGLVKDRGATLHVGLYPARVQVDPALLEQVLELHHWSAADFDVNLVNSLLIEHLKAERIPFVDLTPRFRRASAKRSLYRRQDTHWNAQGNRLAAKILFKELAPIVDRRLSEMNRDPSAGGLNRNEDPRNPQANGL